MLLQVHWVAISKDQLKRGEIGNVTTKELQRKEKSLGVTGYLYKSSLAGSHYIFAYNFSQALPVMSLSAGE